MHARFLNVLVEGPFRAAVGAVSFVLLAACGTGTGQESAAHPAGAEAEIGHIHGVAMDPADNAIYVGAHFGVFKIESPDRASRVGKNRQDTMGFAIVGPRTFLASGHPAADEAATGAPPHLGLIRSTDAGRTWTSVSEVGKADFHALQQAGPVLYVYDGQAQGVRRSDDGGRTFGVRYDAG
ncbi:WD40/YVTN/BNR-like repeat-containing protein [Actinomadura formosensis]|uniref:WD40/YVTN/BNR-like repeat-containing protein n=1 Tax=Actinomadura formosensis TaxID=60706 RepID=UPI003D8FEB44